MDLHVCETLIRGSFKVLFFAASMAYLVLLVTFKDTDLVNFIERSWG